MLEGTERFLRSTEIIGKYLLDLKEYSHHNDTQLVKIEADIAQRVTKAEFAAQTREKSKKLKNKLRTLLEASDEKRKAFEASVNQQMEQFKKKLNDVELNTYWKIKDYEDLLAQRVSETFMKDFVRGELNRAARDLKEHVELEAKEAEKKVDALDADLRKVRDILGEQLG